MARKLTLSSRAKARAQAAPLPRRSRVVAKKRSTPAQRATTKRAPKRRTVVVPPRGSWHRSERRKVERGRSSVERRAQGSARAKRAPRVIPSRLLESAITPSAPTSASRSAPSLPHSAASESRPTGQPASHEPFIIPTGYGDHQIVLMVKDPWWLYAYWELQPTQERQARALLAPEEIAGLQTVLRIYDVSDRNFPDQPAHRFMDIPLSGLANNWYINVDAPDAEFIVDIGLLTRGGRFLLLARSNRVRTPRFGPSDVIDEAWMVGEELYWKLFGLAAGIGGSSGPFEAKELLERARSSWKLFSPTLFSPGFLSTANRQQAKGLWLTVHTDVVVHGTTTPKATVTIEGQPVRVRPDGTFSLRLTLEDGAHALPVQATSPDGRQARAVTQTVSRTTGTGSQRGEGSRQKAEGSQQRAKRNE